MKIFITAGLLLFSLAGRAQNSLEPIRQTMEYFDKGDYENTIKVAEKSLENIKQEFGENSPFYSGMIFFLAISHFKLYHYEKAEPYFIRELELLAKSSGEKNLNYLAGLNGLAQLYREMGRFTESETLYNRALTITKTMVGVNDSIYAKSMNNLASLYEFTGQYAKAEQLYIQSGEIMKRVAGEISALYATNLNNLGTLYVEIGQYPKAKPLLLQVVETRKRVLGENHPDYAGALNNLANLYAAQGDYKEAERLFIEARDLYKKNGGDKNPDYASSLNNLAQLYMITGEYDRAEQLYRESGEIRKKTVGENHPDYAMSLNNLAGFYEFSGRYERAEQLYLQAQAIMKKSVGEVHPYYITTLNNLAGHYDAVGQYAKAEPLYIRALNLRKTLLGESHPSYALSLNNLAVLYQEMGQFAKAEPLYLQAAQIWKKAMGTQHADYAMCLNNMAALYEDMQQYAKAEPLYLQAKDIRKNTLGENHNDYAMSLNNLAGLYAKQGDYKKAEPLLLQAKEIWKKTLGVNNPTYALSLNNVAALYRKAQIKYPEAEQFYLQSLDLRKKILGDEHPLTASTENDLALLYMNMGLPQKAAPLFVTSSRAVMHNLLVTFPVLSEKEKGNYIGENLIFNDCNSSFIFLYPRASQVTAKNNIDLQLFFKSLSLADTRNMLDAIRSSKDTALKRLFDNWQSVKSVLAKQYSLPATQRMKDLAQKEAESENLEKELSRRSAAFRQQQSSLQVSMKDVQQQLAEDEAAIEFVSFRLFNKKNTDSIIYAAYVYRKRDSIASFVPLFEERQLQRLLDSAGKTATGIAGKFYRGVDIKERNASTLVASLYNLVWQPLEPLLRDVKTVSYSPSGKLYGVAFHALRVDSNTLLMDKYHLRQFTSTRQVALKSGSNQFAKPLGIALFGNADFTMDSAQIAGMRDSGKQEDDYTASLRTPPTRGEGNTGGWPELPGTADEVKKIGDLFRQGKLDVKTFVQQSASEEKLKALSGHSPQVLHIATHGFFLPEKIKSANEDGIGRGNTYSLANDPLLRSGLILSGGNYVWSGKAPIEGVEDGIVTAYEISQLNLSNTELVVLSACETALGDIRGTEGVFGLQRAFKMAGVKKMIVSLWQVPDKETAELMTTFYSNWLKGQSIEDAFGRAQAEMRKKYPPFYWAAFVLVE